MAGGKVATIAWAQPGKLSTAVNTLLILLKILVKKKDRDMACIWVKE
jgi:hypothetical protein